MIIPTAALPILTPFPSSPKEEIFRIWGQVLAEHLIRLRRGAVQFDAESGFKLGETTLRVRLARGKIADFNTFSIQEEGFMTYRAILQLLLETTPHEVFAAIVAW